MKKEINISSCECGYNIGNYCFIITYASAPFKSWFVSIGIIDSVIDCGGYLDFFYVQGIAFLEEDVYSSYSCALKKVEKKNNYLRKTKGEAY